MKKTLTIIFFIISSVSISAQENIIEQIVAIVGDKAIFQSDIENQYLQARSQGISSAGDLKCEILEQMLAEKLLVNQAKIDSLEVTEEEVNMQVDQKISYFINQIGGEENLIRYFNKPIYEIKEDLAPMEKDRLYAQKMRSQIAGDIQITPSEVRNFYRTLNEEEIPLVNSKIQLFQIVKYPEADQEAILEVKNRLLELRKRVLDGESFRTLAILYSEDPGTAPKGGEMGLMTKAELVPEFANVAFSLKEGVVSKIVETEFGFHIIQLIERKKEQINVRHILLKPTIKTELAVKAKEQLDSIANKIRNGEITFEKAARYYSEDKDSRLNGGLLINPQTSDKLLEMEQLQPAEYYAIKDLKVGEISDPFETQDKSGRKVFKTLMIKNRIEPHKANLEDDYHLIKQMAAQKKEMEIVEEWLTEKIRDTYIRIDGSFLNCEFQNKGWVK